MWLGTQWMFNKLLITVLYFLNICQDRRRLPSSLLKLDNGSRLLSFNNTITSGYSKNSFSLTLSTGRKGNHQHFHVHFYPFPAPQEWSSLQLWLLNSDHITTVVPDYFAPCSCSYRLWCLCQAGRASNHSQVKIPPSEQQRSSEYQPPERGVHRPWPTVLLFRTTKRDAKHKVMVGISFVHRRKIHLAIPASAVYTGFHDQQVSPNGQHKAVNCSTPLEMQLKILYLGVGRQIDQWAAQMSHDIHINNTRKLPVLPEHREVSSWSERRLWGPVTAQHLSSIQENVSGPGHWLGKLGEGWQVEQWLLTQ